MAFNSNSILDTTKKLLMIPDEYEVFDMDVLIHINSAFSTLHQLKVGPEEGFQITGKETTWSQYLVDPITLSNVKAYLYLSVKLNFDPPETSFAREAMKKNKEELEWRMNVRLDDEPFGNVPPPSDATPLSNSEIDEMFDD